jgi:hypothetical protein
MSVQFIKSMTKSVTLEGAIHKGIIKWVVRALNADWLKAVENQTVYHDV